MGYSSQSGKVIFATQTDRGTPAAFDDGVATKITGGSLAPNRELLIPDAEIGGGRDIVDAVLGTVSFSGDYEYYVRLESLTTLLRGVLGASTTEVDPTSADVWVHTITPTDDAPPFLGAQEKISTGLGVYNYTDAVVNSLHLEAEANGFLTGTASLIACRQSPAPGDVAADAAWDNSSMIVGTNIIVKYAGEVLPAKSFSLDINNNYEDDDFRLGSFYLGDLTPKRREVTASITLRHEDTALFRQATYGTATATAVGGLTTKEELVIECQTYETIGTSTIVSSLTLTFPKAILAPFAFEPSGDDALENDIEIQVVRPDPGTDLLTAVIVNGKEEIA